MCIREKNILPPQVPTLGSRLKFYAHAIACFIILLMLKDNAMFKGVIV
jgi:hypothetical protein